MELPAPNSATSGLQGASRLRSAAVPDPAVPLTGGSAGPRACGWAWELWATPEAQISASAVEVLPEK